MDNNQFRRLAGLTTLSEKKWTGEVDTKNRPPEGLFASGTKASIIEWLKDNHSEYASAMSALNFFINRAGKNLTADRRGVLNSTKDDLRKAYGVKESLEPFDFELLRAMAGLTPATAQAPIAETSDETADASDEEAVKDELPAIITKIAVDAEGKTGDDMIALVKDVYDAGFKDGVKSTEEPSEETVEEAARKNKPAIAAAPTTGQALTTSVGVDKEDDAGWFAVELAKAGMTVDMEEAMGVFYFNFKKPEDGAKALKVAQKLQIEVQ